MTAGVPHAATEDLAFNGRRIPKGSILFPNLVSLSHHEDRYEMADKFEPRRHLGDNNDALESAIHNDWRQRDHFHYGFGRRLCQGISVAESSLFIAIARVLWGFEIRRIPGKRLEMGDTIGTFVYTIAIGDCEFFFG